jgi:hypothetical protein
MLNNRIMVKDGKSCFSHLSCYLAVNGGNRRKQTRCYSVLSLRGTEISFVLLFLLHESKNECVHFWVLCRRVLNEVMDSSALTNFKI